jgi:polar amino acid transport system permease protein
VPLVIARLSKVAPLRWIARTYIELLRGIPPIVWLFIIYFGLGSSVVTLNGVTAAIVTLGAISGAYMAEIYRGGLSAVHVGQWEASAALGMPRTATMSRIIGPQVLRVSVPAGATYAIGLLKDSSIAFAVGVTEITYYANDQSRSTSDAMGPFLIAALVYIAITIPCAYGARRLDASLRRRVAR